MLNTLLESSARKRPNLFTAAVSVMCHSVLMVTAIWFTARDGAARENPGSRVQRLAPYSPPHPEPAPATRSTQSAAAAPSVRLPRVVDIPSVIPEPIAGIGVADLPAIGPVLGDGLRATSPGAVGEGLNGRPFAASEVDEAARPLAGSLVPDYPEPLRRAGVEGGASIRFIVDTTGRVLPSSVTVISAAHELFTAAARAALLRARFKPARVGDQLVQQLVEQPFSFRIRP